MPLFRRCCVPSCSQSTLDKKDLKLFSIPKDVNLAAKWKDNIGIREFEAKENFVCSQHFLPDVLGVKRLRDNAVPTLKLGYREEPAAKPKMQAVFCVTDCTSGEGVVLQELPKTDVGYSPWVLACKSLPAQARDKKLHICDNHLQTYMKVGKRLRDGAHPTIAGRNDSVEASVSGAPPSKLQKTQLVKSEPQKDGIIMEESTDDVRQRHLNVIKQLNEQVDQLQREKEELLGRVIVPEPGATEDAITFAKMIVGKKGTKYLPVEKRVAQNISYMSAKAYKFMKDDLGFRLPSESTLLRDRPIRFVRPGIDEEVVRNLRAMTASLSETQRICEIMWDEVSINKDLTYNKTIEIIDGFEDSGDGCRTQLVGGKCLFFMVKGICSNWKYIISYYVTSNGVCAEDIHDMLFKNIDVALSMGLKVKAALCDQGQSNQNLFTKLGICDTNTTYTYKDVDIHFMYDYCHLIKNIRNHFIKDAADVVTRNGRANKVVVERLYEVDDDNENFKMCPKLTRSHIKPNNFEKMKVRRAAQLFSNSVCAGIETMSEQKLFGQEAAVLAYVEPTRIFVKTMNDLFDELNCKNLKDKNPIRRPIQRESNAFREKRDRLLDHIEYLGSIEFTCSVNVKCVTGFILTIKSMIRLAEDLFHMYPSLQFVMFGKVNQDALENFFYKVRASQGINMHPTANQMQYIVARLISMNILRHHFEDKGNNCEDDDDVFLNWIEDRVIDSNGCNEAIPSADKSDGDEKVPIDDVDKPNPELHVDEFVPVSSDARARAKQFQEVLNATVKELVQNIPDEYLIEERPDKIAEVQIQRYYTGYALYHEGLKKDYCEKCALVMFKSELDPRNSSEALIIAKNYKSYEDPRLKNPTDYFFGISNDHMRWYKEIFRVCAHKPFVKKRVMEYITQKTCEAYPEWFSGECADHRLKLLDFMVTVLLYKNAKWWARAEENEARRRSYEAKKKKNLPGSTKNRKGKQKKNRKGKQKSKSIN